MSITTEAQKREARGEPCTCFPARSQGGPEVTEQVCTHISAGAAGALCSKCAAKVQAQSGPLLAALKELAGQIPGCAIEEARDVWGNTNTRCALDARRKAAKLIAAASTEPGEPWAFRPSDLDEKAPADRPHVFVGRHDRWCELCNRPNRDPIHQEEGG